MRSIKSHNNRFYSYDRNKQKVKVKVTNLNKGDGNFTKNESESCQVVSDFFSSVFTEEDLGKLPDFPKITEFEVNNILVIELKKKKKQLMNF